eukprot:6481597-Amphidinium_carterae.2
MLQKGIHTVACVIWKDDLRARLLSFAVATSLLHPPVSKRRDVQSESKRAKSFNKHLSCAMFPLCHSVPVSVFVAMCRAQTSPDAWNPLPSLVSNARYQGVAAIRVQKTRGMEMASLEQTSYMRAYVFPVGLVEVFKCWCAWCEHDLLERWSAS